MRDLTANTCYCIHCGEQHTAVPPKNICTSCGQPKVVDLANADPAEIARALQARHSPRWNLVSIFVLAAAAALVLIIMVGPSRCGGSQPLIVWFDGAESKSLAIYMHEISTKGSEILECYRGAKVRSRGDHSPHRLTMEWTIGADGALTSVDIGVSSVPNAVGLCATERIEAWRFEPPVDGKPVEVVWPFLFPVKQGEVTIWSPRNYVVGND